VEAILDGRQPKGLRLAEMLGNGPLAWGSSGGMSAFATQLDNCHLARVCSKSPLCITHTPGHMILTDLRNAALAVF
jgi:hypothetical protein